MCGIAGFFGRSDKKQLERMLTSIQHRGPDENGLISNSDFSLGACRLSILDLELGKQPLSNSEKTIWAAQNGEIYNYPELRKALEKRCFKFSTRCDTEILPSLYQEHGFNFVTRLLGMFAIAIWDDSTKEGYLYRDRLGKKPLYYTRINETLCFASEIKALLTVPGVSKQINKDALSHFFSFKNTPCPLTIFDNIFQVPAGSFLKFKNGEISIQRYWRSDFIVEQSYLGASDEELAEELLLRIRRAVKRRFLSDVPIGFFLSGGIDSSLIACIAAEESRESISTFNLGYSEEATTEGKSLDAFWASEIAKQIGSKHFQEQIEIQDFPSRLHSIIRSFDEPFSGALTSFFISEQIAKHVKVAISGDGADELFGSYLSHRLAASLSNSNGTIVDSSQLSDLKQVKVSNLSEPWKWRSNLFVFEHDEKQKLFSREFVDSLSDFHSEHYLKILFSEANAKELLNQMLEVEQNSQLPNQVLTYADRLSMAHSLEVRSPFLDEEVVEFANQLPGRTKIRDGKTKYLLKLAAARYLPLELIERKKEGFILPINHWIAGSLETYVRETLSSKNLSKHGMLSVNFVNHLLDSIYNTKEIDYRQINKLFSVLIFQEWWNLYLAGS